MNLWLYRRLADQKNFKPGTYPGDLSLVNWPQNDYHWDTIDVALEEASKHIQRQTAELVAALLDANGRRASRRRGGAQAPAAS